MGKNTRTTRRDEPAANDEPVDGAMVDDTILIDGLVQGDADALRQMMKRYDRLVRYTIWNRSKDRCRRDGAWLDALASTVWTGFVEAVRRVHSPPPTSVKAYLARMAANQTVSALRSVAREREKQDLDANRLGESLASSEQDPAETIAHVEMLDALHACLNELDEADRTIASQMYNITERRWRQAAQALGMTESTLRSRWKRILERLRANLVRKTGLTFAPEAPASDSLGGDRVSLAPGKQP